MLIVTLIPGSLVGAFVEGRGLGTGFVAGAIARSGVVARGEIVVSIIVIGRKADVGKAPGTPLVVL